MSFVRAAMPFVEERPAIPLGKAGRNGAMMARKTQRRVLGRGSVQRKVESATGTLNFWLERSIRVRLFCESSATQPRSRSPAGADASRTKTIVIVPYSGRFG